MPFESLKMQTRFKFFTILMPLIPFKTKFPPSLSGFLVFNPRILENYIAQNPEFSFETFGKAKSCQEHFPDLSYARYTQESRMHSRGFLMSWS